ncbi:MAG: general secretion pathway protein GspM [Arenimonas sp.]|nr:general secretion pathway protein GspM [Arenimonas sp.]MBP8097808.1 general secretion pathway protein GspM [Arenimonas sp.]
MSPVAVPDRWRVFGGVLLALLLAYLALVHWWFTAPMLAMGGEIENMRDQERALLSEVGQRPQLRKTLADVRKFEASNPGFLPEASRELASAGLVLRLQQVVANASPNPNACQITAQTPTDMPTQEPFARVMVQVRLRCGMGELGAVLHALESGSPQLFIDNLDILSRRSYLATGTEGAGGLDISFDLYGYLKSAPGGSRG